MTDPGVQQPASDPKLPLLVAAVGCVAIVLAALGIGLATGGGTRDAVVVNAKLTQWSIQADPSAPAGDVTFVVTNAGSMVHEMLVLKTKEPADKLPITDAGDPPEPVDHGADKVDEGTSVGETGSPDMKAGAVRSFTIKHMTPGRYVLVCNIGGHYAQGMRTAFTVTRSA